MKFKMEINSENAAFEGDEIAQATELLYLLKRASDRIELVPGINYFSVLDSNGNTVGSVSIDWD